LLLATVNRAFFEIRLTPKSSGHSSISISKNKKKSPLKLKPVSFQFSRFIEEINRGNIFWVNPTRFPVKKGAKKRRRFLGGRRLLGAVAGNALTRDHVLLWGFGCPSPVGPYKILPIFYCNKGGRGENI